MLSSFEMAGCERFVWNQARQQQERFRTVFVFNVTQKEDDFYGGGC